MNFEEKRKKLVNNLKNRDYPVLTKLEVIRAMLKVPRHLFVPKDAESSAYIDSPLSIGSGQTISAPHMNAMMCEYLEIKEKMKILEIGTGSGYHAALLSILVGKEGHVFSIERHKKLTETANRVINSLNYENITLITQDGTIGLPKQAPFDRILVTTPGFLVLF